MSLAFEGQQIEVRPGDSVAAAVFRSGVRTFSRSFKYHRRRGLYCMSGDCANCLLEVDGESDVRSCLCAAKDGMTALKRASASGHTALVELLEADIRLRAELG